VTWSLRPPRRNLSIALSSLLIFAVAIEAAGAGILAATGWEWSVTVRSGQAHLVYDVVRQWKLRRSFSDGPLRINGHGFRGAEVAISPSPSRLRILALGDSITFGTYDCPDRYCDEEFSYPAALQRELALLRDVEVLNAGTEGYNSDKSLTWYSEQLSVLRADVVVVMVGWNDILESSSASTASARRGRLEGFGALAAVDGGLRRWSHGYRAAWYAGKALLPGTPTELEGHGQRPAPPAVEIDERKITAYEANLRSFARTARALGARVVLMTLAGALGDPTTLSESDAEAIRRRYGWPDLAMLAAELARYNQVVRRVATEEAVTLVDFAAIVDGLGGRSLYVLPDINHPTHAAIARISTPLARAFVAAGLTR
jgi:lysophospholipase L1-like esterase